LNATPSLWAGTPSSRRPRHPDAVVRVWCACTWAAGAADAPPKLLGRLPKPRRALLAQFADADGTPLDLGLALYFPGTRLVYR
jgi:hypothetical protein